MTVQEIKKEFFTYRNGIIADALRRIGYPHSVIFGLNLPQISTLARQICEQPTADEEALRSLADRLWEDASVRESRMLACFLYQHTKLTQEEALIKALECSTREEADLLAFKVIKRRNDADRIYRALEEIAAVEPDNKATITALEALKAHLSSE